MIEELILKAKNKDVDALQAIFLEYKVILYKIARTRLRNIEDIEDAFQDTIIEVYKNIGKLKDVNKFKSWIITILINKCNKILKNKKYDLSYEKLTEVNFNGKDPSNTSEEDFRGIKDYEKINNIEFQELLDRLSIDERTIITLHYLEGYKSCEIAKILKKSDSTIRVKLMNARNKIKVMIKEAEDYE